MITQSAKVFQEKWIENQHKRHNNPDKYALVSTGLSELDTLMGGGYELGQYGLIGGAQKSGKTTLLMKMMKSAAFQKKRFIWFGAEMNNFQLGSMIFSNITGIERTKIRKIGLELFDWQALERAAHEIENWQGYFNYGFATLKDINKVIKEVEHETGLPVEIIFGDYIQLMEAPDIKGGRVSEIESISRGIKHLTIDRPDGHPVAAIFAAQLNRQSIRGALVDANAFLGSGALERDMDFGMIIHDFKDDANRKVEHKKRIVIVGSRETGSGELDVLYNGATASIEDDILEQRPEVDYWNN